MEASSLRYVSLLLFALLLALTYKLCLSDEGGLQEMRRLEKQLEQQKKENAELKKRNDTLSAEVEDLKKGTEAIEERARFDFGLIKPGETFYQVIETDPKESLRKSKN